MDAPGHSRSSVFTAAAAAHRPRSPIARACAISPRSSGGSDAVRINARPRRNLHRQAVWHRRRLSRPPYCVGPDIRYLCHDCRTPLKQLQNEFSGLATTLHILDDMLRVMCASRRRRSDVDSRPAVRCYMSGNGQSELNGGTVAGEDDALVCSH
jgi:hypothetical protein